MAKEPTKYPYDDQFPDNVDPSDKNRREFSKKREKEMEDAKREAESQGDNE